jgi:3',5'-cyclic AMP phosphodiesterase CpdA
MRRFWAAGVATALAAGAVAVGVTVAVQVADDPDRRAAPTGSPSPTATATATGTPTPTPTAAAAPPVLLGVIGDFGLRGGVAPTMVEVLRGYAREHAASGRLAALVTTGDNAYPVGSTADVAFARGLLDPLLGGGTRLVATLGNHDAATRGGAPAMSGLGMPARWYTTVVGPVQLVVLDANHPEDAAQTRWLRRTLAAPRPATYRVVVFHQPVASCSAHPADRAVARAWLPLLDRGTDLVLSGHNHTYERFRDPAGLPLVTTGGGGATLYPSLRLACTGTATPQVLRSRYNVVVLAATPDRLQLTALDRRGRVIDRLVVPAR